MSIEKISTLKELINRAELAIEKSKKLSTKTRNKMKESTFCGQIGRAHV